MAGEWPARYNGRVRTVGHSSGLSAAWDDLAWVWQCVHLTGALFHSS